MNYSSIQLSHAAGVGVVAVLGGCAQFNAVTDPGHIKETQEQVSRVDQHSSYPAIRRDTFEQVNLLELIDPQGESIRDGYNHNWGRRIQTDGDENAGAKFGQRYDLVLTWFSRQPDHTGWKRLRRNSVQDKIIAVSTSRCNVFKTYLRRQQVDVNFTLGSLTTISGVLGAVLPGVTASRNLAGAAGLFSGLRGEYNQSYYSNLAAHVIVQGVELRQNRLKKELIEGRQGRGIDDYSMEAAINDAIVIDGNCSTVAGLIEAQDSIREVESPGLRLAARAMASANALKEISATPVSQLAKDGSLEKLLSMAGSEVPSMLVTSTRFDALGAAGNSVAGARDAVTRVAAQIDYRAGTVMAEFERLQAKATADSKKSKLSPSAVRASFTSAVTTAVFDPLVKKTEASPNPVLTACVEALGAPVGALGAANASLLLAHAGADTRITAQLALDQARATANAAIARVERVVDAAITAIDHAAQKSIVSLQAESLEGDGLSTITAEKLTALMKVEFDWKSLGCK